MASEQSLKLALLVVLSIITLNLYVIPTCALNIGVQANGDLALGKECSRTCESKFCGVAPFLRYGKYCGLLYSGCPGERPCDGLDACCMQHDHCIQANNNDYLSESCNQSLLKCVNLFKKSKAPTFTGNTCKIDDVVKIIDGVIDAAIVAGKIFGRH